MSLEKERDRMDDAAVNSPSSTMDPLQKSSRNSPSQSFMTVAELMALQQSYDASERRRKRKITEREKAVDAQVREAVYKLEDKIESHVSDQWLSKSECQLDGQPPHPLEFSIDLRDLMQDILSFREKVKEWKREYEEVLPNLSSEEDAAAASAAVTSLRKTIERLRNSSRISLVPPSPQIIGLAYKELMSLQQSLEELDGRKSKKRQKAVDAQVREAVCKLEDIIESHVSEQLLSQSECQLDGQPPHPLLVFSIDLQYLNRDILSFWKKMKELKREYEEVLLNSLSEEEEDDDDDDDAITSSISAFSGDNSKMVGLSDQFESLRSNLLEGRTRLTPCSIFGMAGIGKTALAKKIFEDPLIVEHFHFRAWVTVGQKRTLKHVLRAITAQLDPSLKDAMVLLKERIIEDAKLHPDHKDEILKLETKQLAGNLRESLKDRRYLIVLDDSWNTLLCDDLIEVLQLYNNGNRVLQTSRIQRIEIFSSAERITNMRLLNKEESWVLLCEKVFAENLCPPELEKPGKKIAENCDGLPLTIITVANLLSKAEKTPEYWNEVAEKQNSVSRDAHDNMLKVLSPSYEYLPKRLKVCFLYMGVFPQKYQIPRSKLINRLIAEGFLTRDSTRQNSEKFPGDYVSQLLSNSVVTEYENSTFPELIKKCGLHSSFLHLSVTEARKNKFFHILNSGADELEENIKSQCRLCVHNNVLFGIKSVYNSIEHNCKSTARSLLCFGPYHQYQVPICFGLRLLRVLDALTIRFYEFPMEVLKLVQLRYLAITYNGKLPPSIAKLWNLQFLIIHRHLSIKSYGAPSYVPMVIWDMQQLKHIQIMGSNLPNPNSDNSLQNLSTLLDVSASSCTKEVLTRIPKLKKLGIRIELVHDVAETLGYLNHISCLKDLESLKCVIVNPEFRSMVVAPSTPRLKFPLPLKKLTLSGFGYPWKSMKVIASLPNLRVLKLQCYAFRGQEWEIKDNSFSKLESLLIEDTDLVQWKIGRGSCPWLFRLSIKHCYKLEEIYMDSKLIHLSKIEVVDCNPSTMIMAPQLREGGIEVSDWNSLAMTTAEQLMRQDIDRGPITAAFRARWRQSGFPLGVDVHSSWVDN